LVRHGHFDVNGQKTNVPSFLVEEGDVIAVRERGRKLAYFRDLSTVMEHKVVPEWLSLDIAKMEGRVLTFPTREEIDASLNEQLVVEYYSR
jgi:small subunit ribosomal protein S4